MTPPKRPSAIRLLLVEDYEVVRQGTRKLLDEQPDLLVVGEAADAPQAVELAERLQPDLVLLDLRLGEGGSGFVAARHIQRLVPRVAFLVLTGLDDPEYARVALEIGIRGYLRKSAGIAEIVAAIHRVHAGERVLDDQIAIALAGSRRPAPPVALDHLTDRERAVFRLLGRGDSNAEMAAKLDISVRTAETHVANLLQKLRLRSRAAAISLAARQVAKR